MKALVYTGPLSMVYRDEPDPVSNEDSIVAVSACGICGSDMHGYHGHDPRRPPPLILGHEAAGTVVEGELAGKRVTINPLVTCGTCDPCLSGRMHLCASRQIISLAPRQGALAEKVVIPARNLVEIPDGMPFELAALTEPMAVGYHAVNRGERALHLPLAAARIAVIGGGAIGLGTAQILRSRGARKLMIAETSQIRRAALSSQPQFVPYDPANAAAAPAASSMDLVVDAYGGPKSREEASRLIAPGGVIVHIGLASAEGGFDIRKATLQEITFIGTYCYTMTEFRETLAGLATGQFGDIDWFEQRPLAEGARAFDDLHEGRVAKAKIVLRM